MGCVFECDGGGIFMIQPTLNKRLFRANSPPTMKSIGSKNEPRPMEGESKSNSESNIKSNSDSKRESGKRT